MCLVLCDIVSDVWMWSTMCNMCLVCLMVWCIIFMNLQVREASKLPKCSKGHTIFQLTGGILESLFIRFDHKFFSFKIWILCSVLKCLDVSRWCFLMCLDVSWCVLMCFDVSWCVLMCLYVFWCVLMCLGLFWCVLMCLEVSWSVLMCLAVFWCIMVCLDVSWCVSMCLDVSWSVLMCLEVSSCVLVCLYVSSWCVLLCLDVFLMYWCVLCFSSLSISGISMRFLLSLDDSGETPNGTTLVKCWVRWSHLKRTTSQVFILPCPFIREKWASCVIVSLVMFLSMCLIDLFDWCVWLMCLIGVFDWCV